MHFVITMCLYMTYILIYVWHIKIDSLNFFIIFTTFIIRNKYNVKTVFSTINVFWIKRKYNNSCLRVNFLTLKILFSNYFQINNYFSV